MVSAAKELQRLAKLAGLELQTLEGNEHSPAVVALLEPAPRGYRYEGPSVLYRVRSYVLSVEELCTQALTALLRSRPALRSLAKGDSGTKKQSAIPGTTIRFDDPNPSRKARRSRRGRVKESA